MPERQDKVSHASTTGMHLDRVYQMLLLYCEISVKPTLAELGDGELSSKEVCIAPMFGMLRCGASVPRFGIFH